MTSAAVAVMLTASAAGAATVTFTGLPDEGAQLTSWSEDGILTTGEGGTLAALSPGSAQVDDSGTGFASSLTFSTGGVFAATSFDILPLANFYEFCQTLDEGEVDRSPYSFADVAVTGYADGTVVAFDMFAVNGTYTFSDAFAGLDLLVIGFASLPTDLPSGSYLSCDGSPYRRFSVQRHPCPGAAARLGRPARLRHRRPCGHLGSGRRSGQAEPGAVPEHGVHDDGKPARKRDAGLAHG